MEPRQEPTTEQRQDMEMDARLELAVQEAEMAFQEAYRTLAELSKELGFPLTRSLRPEERHKP